MSPSRLFPSRGRALLVTASVLPLLAACGPTLRPHAPQAAASKAAAPAPTPPPQAVAVLATFTSGTVLQPSAWQKATVGPWKPGVPTLRTTQIGLDRVVLTTAPLSYRSLGCANPLTTLPNTKAPTPQTRQVVFRAVLRAEGDRTATMARIEATGRSLPCAATDGHLIQIAEDLSVRLALALRQR